MEKDSAQQRYQINYYNPWKDNKKKKKKMATSTRFDHALVSQQTKASNEHKHQRLNMLVKRNSELESQLMEAMKRTTSTITGGGGGYKNFGVMEKNIEEMTKTLQKKEQTIKRMHSDTNIATGVSMSRYAWGSMSPLDHMKMVPDNNIATRVSMPESSWRRSMSPPNYEKMYSDNNITTRVSTHESSWKRCPSSLNYEKMYSDNNIATRSVSMQLIT